MYSSTSAGTLDGLIYGVLALLVVVGIGGVFTVLVVANRASPDPSGRRPFVVYQFGVAFITIWTALLGSVTLVSSLVQLIGSHGPEPTYTCGTLGTSRSCSPVPHAIGDAAARGAVLGGLVCLLSVGLLIFHLRGGMLLVDSDSDATSPAKRVARSYVSAVLFVSVFVAVLALVYFIYAIFQVAAPGVFGASGRIPALRHLLDSLFVVVAAVEIFRTHQVMAPPQLGPVRNSRDVGSPPPSDV